MSSARNLQINYRNIGASDAIRVELESYYDRLVHKYPRTDYVTVTVSESNRSSHRQHFDVHVHAKLGTEDYYSGFSNAHQDAHDDFHTAVKTAFDQIDREIRRQSERKREAKRAS